MNNLKTFLDDLLHIGGDSRLQLEESNFDDLYQKMISMIEGQPPEQVLGLLGLYRVLFRIERLPSSQESRYKLTIFVNGMKHFDGFLTSTLKLNGVCSFFKEGILINTGSYYDGQKDGKFIHYDFDTGTEISTEVYEKGVKTSDIYVVNGKKYLDTIEGGKHMIGQVILKDNKSEWSGRVLEFHNNKPSRLLHYGATRTVAGVFSQYNGTPTFVEYDESRGMLYFGEIAFDDHTLEYKYEGRGMKFVSERNSSSLVYKGEFKNGVYCGNGCLFDPKSGLKLFEGEFADGKPVNGVSFCDGMATKFEVSTMDDLRSFPPNYNLFEVLEGGLRNETNVDFLQFVGHVERIVFGPASCDSLEVCRIWNFQNLREIRFEKNCLKSVRELIISRSGLSSILLCRKPELRIGAHHARRGFLRE